MKKIIALLLCFIMLFALCACGKGEPSVGMPNPMSEYESLAEVNEAVGGNLSGPAVMGASDEAYFVIDCGSYQIGEYRFNVNGCDYTMRCAKAKEDISGIYLSGQEGTAFSEAAAAGDNGMQLNSDGEYKCARWFVDDMQYVLTAHDGGKLDDETFSSIANELMNKTQGNM